MTARWAPRYRNAILPLDDFWGKENCSEILVLSRPDIIKDIHAAYFKARGRRGRDQHVWRRHALFWREFDLADKVHEINIAGGGAGAGSGAAFFRQRQAAFVAGSMGPRTKLPSLGQISFDDMLRHMLSSRWL